MIRQTEQMISLRQPRVPVKPPASTTNALHTMQANQPGSRVERALRRALWSAGERGFRVQSRLPGKPDVVFPTARRAIFVHGCFWHRCARCAPPVPKRNREFWAHKFSTTVRRDAKVARALRRNGWRVSVVWECQIEDDAAAIAHRIAAANRRESAARRGRTQ